MPRRTLARHRLSIAVGLSLSAIAGTMARSQTAPATQPVSTLPATLPATASESEEVMTEVVVTGRADSLVGIAASASQGTVGAKQLEARPLLRPGEVLETVPGMIVTQHSGAGKANQFFLRGFNLDHGTDFATDVAGTPVNMPTHAHGQGYTDLNFMIPELIETVNFRKGPYFAEEGDFASAGAADIEYFNVLPSGMLHFEGGNFGYYRALVADSPRVGNGNLLYAFEFLHSDGPWDDASDFNKFNAVLRYSEGDRRNGWSVTGMGYKAYWGATDQIAERAVAEGLIDRFGTLDDTDGGYSQRYSLSAEAHQSTASSFTTIGAFAYYYDLDLYSNFTCYLDDLVNGDQFLQSDRRIVSGIRAAHTMYGTLFDRETEWTIGIQVRNDYIDEVALRSTASKEVLSTTRADQVVETSVGVYLENKTQWTDTFRTTLGLRGDYFQFDVDSDNELNSGNDDDFILSPKAGLVVGPFDKTEFYLNGGLGFHSNDARGVTTRVDPSTGDPVSGADPLVRTYGAEVGIRTSIIPGLQSSAAVWYLKLDSELLFVGDAGTTDVGRPSERYGIEFANYYTPTDGLTFDFDITFSHARFTNSDPAGDYIPGAIETTIAAGVTYEHPSGWFGGLRVRFLGARPLTEDDGVRADSTCLVNARVGYHINETWTVAADFFNLLDQDENDIEYYYQSRLPGEGPDGFDDTHFHPAEPFAFRVGVMARF